MKVLAETKYEPQLISPTNAPAVATYWSFQRTNYPPLPLNNWPDLPLYYLGYGNNYLIDDSSVDYAAIYAKRAEEKAAKKVLKELGLLSAEEWDEEDGGGMMLWAYEYPSNYLYLEMALVTNGWAYVILNGTIPDVAYELLSREEIKDTNWISEGIVIGAPEQDWTEAMIPVGSRTNSLFVWARSWQDSDGDGLPDWYEMEVTGTDPNNPDTGDTGVSDGYNDGDGDGWNNLQEYQNGTNPNGFNTPPAPQGLNVYFHADTGMADVGWQSSAGPITGYTVERFISELWHGTNYNFSASTNSFEDELALPRFGGQWVCGFRRKAASVSRGRSRYSNSPVYGTTICVEGPGWLSPPASFTAVRRTFNVAPVGRAERVASLSVGVARSFLATPCGIKGGELPAAVPLIHARCARRRLSRGDSSRPSGRFRSRRA